MATINGTFNSLIAGTLSGTVATPGATGPAGPAGPAGPQGVPGTPGVGVPVGGTSGQVLAKVDGVDYNTEWIDQSAPDFISSVSSPLAVTTGNLTIDLSAYAQLSGATFTGNVFAPTPSPGTDSTRIATTEWVKDFDYAQTNSPQFTGNPRSVTPSLSDDDTSIATTAFVKGQNYLTSSALSGYALLSGATFSGKVNFTPVSGVAGLNVGIGGNSTASTTNGDLWIATGGVSLNFRDGNGAWRIVAVANTLNTFSAPQIIDTTSTTTALRVTQKGTGNAIQVEDSTTPDSTAFVVDQFGKVGIGVAPDATAALKVDTNGIMFGDGTTQYTAASGSSYSENNAIADMITGRIIETSLSGTDLTVTFMSNRAFSKSNFGDDVTVNGISATSWSNASLAGDGTFMIDATSIVDPYLLAYKGASASLPFGNFGT
jgi:hypothetical protein